MWDHVTIRASDRESSRSFYELVLGVLGHERNSARGTTFGIAQADDGDPATRNLHVAFVARSREDVDRLHDLLRQIGATIIQDPQEGTWAPGYYSVLFEDPDGIRLEANFVPGAGVLQPDVKFNPAAGYST